MAATQVEGGRRGASYAETRGTWGDETKSALKTPAGHYRCTACGNSGPRRAQSDPDVSVTGFMESPGG